ncbi:helix-turn-helix domain-containing protein [Streptosporangium sp. NBC_01469]|uniref:helix-turn-helix domain-containing protein n=1 Tax=Streptosporangium sp. NBC_01469 TaxID=2903898 RepID=UPI002E2E54B7|nr:helix-turn-helix transcriptional regulator [Streptosporangium sp. NBC_01469]
MTLAEEAEQFAARLRMLKERSGSSFEALARQTGISRSSLHRYCAGTKLPAGYGPVHAFAKACGASSEELRELHRLWALADAARPSAAPAATSPNEPSADDPPPGDGRDGWKVVAEPSSRPVAPASREHRRARRPVVVAAVTISLVATATTAFVMLAPERDPGEPTVVKSQQGTVSAIAPVRVFNIEGNCKKREERVPSCSMGLARDPRRKYDAHNVVGHRVWHDDVLNADCVLYEGDRVEDETGVGTTRWFRVRLPQVPGGIAWLPAVRTHDNPTLPICA